MFDISHTSKNKSTSQTTQISTKNSKIQMLIQCPEKDSEH